MFVIFALGERKNDKRKKQERTTLPKEKRRLRKSWLNRTTFCLFSPHYRGSTVRA
jgi:hypothetical protein